MLANVWPAADHCIDKVYMQIPIIFRIYMYY